MSQKFDLITFGSATLDIIVPLKKKNLKKLKKEKGIFLSLGEKLDVDEIFIKSGGGGTNAAATFAVQGLNVAFCGMVGEDFAGRFVLEDLKKYKINTQFVLKTKKYPTNFSLIFLANGENTVLSYRGASNFLRIKEIPFKRLIADWFYLAPLTGKLKDDFLKIINFAKRKGIKVALNPSKQQLRSKKIKEALKKVDVLILNESESSFLTKIPKEKEGLILKKLYQLTSGIFLVTKGKSGAIGGDRKYLYFAPALKTKVVDTTGAGDSFGAGFVAQFIKTQDIVSSIQFAIANSASNLKAIGAKEGILKGNEKYLRVKVKRERWPI